MNVQLRDSLSLQTALLTKHKRNALPKAQLHPELLEAHVEAESGGFILSTENPIDIGHLNLFFAGSETHACTASWRMFGKAQNEIPGELKFAFAEGGTIVIRTQAVGDVTRLTQVIPSDRSMNYDVTVADGNIIFLPQATQREAPTSSKTDAQLQLEAAKLGVKWDKKASRETMIERIAEAKTAKV